MLMQECVSVALSPSKQSLCSTKCFLCYSLPADHPVPTRFKIPRSSSPQLHDIMQPKQKRVAKPAAAAPEGGGAGGDYVPLSLIGKVREKGFSADGSSHHGRTVSAPQPRITPFPVARHRSEGPSVTVPPPPTPRAAMADASVEENNVELKKQAEIAEERCFYQCNIAFHGSRTGAYKRFVNAISAVAGASITPARSEALRTTRLTCQVDMVHGMLEGHRESWAVYGCIIISDKWKDVQKRHPLNALVSCCTGTTFLRAIDMSGAGICTSGELIFSHIRAAIEEVGPVNVVQVVIDNASNSHKLHLARRSDAQRSDRVLLTQWNTYVERIYNHGHVQNRLEEDLLEYRGGRGNFSRVIAKTVENQALPISWWEKFGGLNFTLQTLALRVLSQDVSSTMRKGYGASWEIYIPEIEIG
ncbi:hypothetical protein L7F22_049063 [Adiantum nelumboides]|nr:hypothetical protein [Adiantum nelumboides]